jgi:cytoskeleton-associated protein 5
MSTLLVHFADEVYDHLSAAFDDPSATIVYPYVYRILNSNSGATRPVEGRPRSATNGSLALTVESTRPGTPESRAFSPPPQSASAASSSRYLDDRRISAGSQTSRSHSSNGGASPNLPTASEPDPDARLIEIIGHISSEKTGALHKEGITELHHFLKDYPHKKPKVDKLLDATGPQFRKYISRALATRALEDEERGILAADAMPRKSSSVDQPLLSSLTALKICRNRVNTP